MAPRVMLARHVAHVVRCTMRRQNRCMQLFWTSPPIISDSSSCQTSNSLQCVSRPHLNYLHSVSKLWSALVSWECHKSVNCNSSHWFVLEQIFVNNLLDLRGNIFITQTASIDLLLYKWLIIKSTAFSVNCMVLCFSLVRAAEVTITGNRFSFKCWSVCLLASHTTNSTYAVMHCLCITMLTCLT